MYYVHSGACGTMLFKEVRQLLQPLVNTRKDITPSSHREARVAVTFSGASSHEGRAVTTAENNFVSDSTDFGWVSSTKHVKEYQK